MKLRYAARRTEPNQRSADGRSGGGALRGVGGESGFVRPPDASKSKTSSLIYLDNNMALSDAEALKWIEAQPQRISAAALFAF